MPNSNPIEHDRRVKRWVLIISIIAAFFATMTVLALAWGWTNSQDAAEAGQELATIVDTACEDPEVHDQLGDACPRAAEVKKDNPDPLPIPGINGRDGRDGIDGIDGTDGRPGPPGPRGLRGFRGLLGDPGAPGEDGADGVNGADGADGDDGQNGTNGVDGSNGPPGERGPEGPAGPQGPEGPAGPQGEPGAQGPQGPDGPPGPNCPQGYTGRELDVTTKTIPPETQTIFACVKDPAPTQ